MEDKSDVGPPPGSRALAQRSGTGFSRSPWLGALSLCLASLGDVFLLTYININAEYRIPLYSLDVAADDPFARALVAWGYGCALAGLAAGVAGRRSRWGQAGLALAVIVPVWLLIGYLEFRTTRYYVSVVL